MQELAASCYTVGYARRIATIFMCTGFESRGWGGKGGFKFTPPSKARLFENDGRGYTSFQNSGGSLTDDPTPFLLDHTIRSKPSARGNSSRRLSSQLSCQCSTAFSASLREATRFDLVHQSPSKLPRCLVFSYSRLGGLHTLLVDSHSITRHLGALGASSACHVDTPRQRVW